MSTDNPFLDPYQTHLRKAGKSQHTIRAYLGDVRAFARWFTHSTGETFHPQAVASEDIQDFRGYLIRQGRASSTINRRLRALVTCFRWAKSQGLISHNPFDILDQVGVKEQRQQIAPLWLNRKEQLALLRAVRQSGSNRDWAIIQTLLGTGLRISELAALELSDIELSERKGWLRVRAGKGMKQRDIPLDKKTRQILADYLATRGVTESQHLFIGQRGPINQSGIHYLVKKYAYQARLVHCTATPMART